VGYLLVDRFQRAFQIWSVLALAARNRQVLTYDLLSHLIGVPRMGLGQMLEPIQSYCILNRLPALTSLVVSEESGVPGQGFIASHDVPREQVRVFNHDWLAQISPNEEVLQQAAERLPTNGRPLVQLQEELDFGG
jgi:putative restriction endonuclease